MEVDSVGKGCPKQAKAQGWRSSQVLLCPVAPGRGILPTGQSTVLADFHISNTRTWKWPDEDLALWHSVP